MYLIWSLIVYFGSLASNSHEWWPLFLYFIIWPVSALYEFVDLRYLDWLFPDPKSVSDRAYMLNDYIGGAFYIIVGTIWIWFLGIVISKMATRLFPVREHETVA
jgi:hypothetical protein